VQYKKLVPKHNNPKRKWQQTGKIQTHPKISTGTLILFLEVLLISSRRKYTIKGKSCKTIIIITVKDFR